jgi:cytochrome c oxidase subunit 1
MGGISGVIIGGPQVNMITHNTLLVPAHFHMTVVAGTTAAFMGLAYYVVPLIFRRELMLRSWARYQPYVYGAGMLIWGLGMGLAGHWGVPRRHWDITFQNAPEGLRFNLLQSPEINFFLAVLGIGAIIAVIGGAMFVLSIVGTVFLGRRSATPNIGNVHAAAFSSVPAIAGAADDTALGSAAHADEHGFEVPGTLVLAIAFLALFGILYGISWHELSSVPWRLY